MEYHEFLTSDEAAELLRIRRQTLFKWIGARKIPSYEIGGRTLLKKSELLAWIEAGRRTAVGEN